MVKSLANTSFSTPLRLFGKDYAPETLLVPISTMHIPRVHLPSPKSLSVRMFPVISRWWRRHSYKDIQGGSAELVIIGRKNVWEWNIVRIWAVLVLVALLSFALRLVRKLTA
jgi:hypothetical protein